METAAGDLRLEDGALGRDAARVTREVDAGLETLEVDLPAVITTDLRLNEPRYVKLPGHHEGEEEAARDAHAGALGVEPTPASCSCVRFEPPPQRQKGVRVKDAAELVDALRKQRIAVSVGILIVAEHDGAKLNASTAKCVSCAARIPGRRNHHCGAGRGCRGASRHRRRS